MLHADFDQKFHVLAIINTDLGPVLRMWVPYKGWHYAIACEGDLKIPIGQRIASAFKAGAPCDVSPLRSILHVSS